MGSISVGNLLFTREYYNDYNSDYLSLCNNTVIHPKIKIELLTHEEYVIGEITQEISLSNSGTISINYAQGVRRSCSFSLINIDGKYFPSENSFFWINRKFKLFLGLKSENGEIYWWSQGIFITKNATVSDYTVNIDAIDKFGLFTEDLKQHVLQGDYLIPAGENIVTAIKDTIILGMGDPQNKPIDPIEPIIDVEYINEKFPYDIKKSSGESLGSVLTEIATALGSDIYYDTEGHLIFTRTFGDSITSEYVYMAHQWDFDKSNSELSSSSISFDLGNVINAVTVRSTDAMQDDYNMVYSYTAKNNNPTSPVRVSAIGLKWSEVVETPMATSKKKCYQYANYLLKKNTLIATTLSIKCSLIPHLDVGKTIGLTYEEYGYDKATFIIQTIDISLDTGEMEISASLAQWLPIDIESSATLVVS